MELIGTSSIDVYIGRRIKLRRGMLGITQKQLASSCGISSQLIQKYEVGETRIAPRRLVQLGRALDVPVSFLFSGLPNQTPAGDYISAARSEECNLRAPGQDDPLSKNESLELVKLYWALPNDDVRTNIMGLLKSMI